MKITPEILEQQWGRIKYTDGGFLQIDTQHPLEWHIGYQSISQRTLLLVSDTEINGLPHFWVFAHKLLHPCLRSFSPTFFTPVFLIGVIRYLLLPIVVYFLATIK